MVGHEMQGVALQPEDARVVGGTEAGGALGRRVQHGLQVGRRARDDPQDPGGRGLLLTRLGKLGPKPSR